MFGQGFCWCWATDALCISTQVATLYAKASCLGVSQYMGQQHPSLCVVAQHAFMVKGHADLQGRSGSLCVFSQLKVKFP